ncbi:hypothetical protein P9222_02360 [Paenibacillus amylolyticus]|nr:hypothetical protein [Paenibacillus amylolyticus]WFR63270.1 hypothetical protein P9222_02360 [Paenibacillus amylolyticus]
MEDFHSLYTLHREQVREELYQEKTDGIKLGFFYALMNIVKELSPLQPESSRSRSGWIIWLFCGRLMSIKKPVLLYGLG